jgi:putative ABC transport system permease protein
MKTGDLFEESYSALTVNKVRTTLTMLGIIIGIGSVITMVAIGQGAQSSIAARINSIGSNLIIVTPGAQRGAGITVSAGLGSSQSLTLADEIAVKSQVTGISAAEPELSKRYQVTAKGTNTNTNVTGTNSNYLTVRNVSMDTGSFITDQQVMNLNKVAVIGPTVRDTLFGIGADAVGQTIKINSIQFKVIGVTVVKGGSGFTNQDNLVFIPISVAQRFLVGPNSQGQDYLSSIAISADSASNMTSVQQQVTDLLTNRHKITNPTQADFTVQNQADIVSAASGVASTFTILLASVAAISLLVGGIGIMNMMLTTVTERTREIGLRKAIGATRRDINLQFLTEAIILTFTGGIMGIIFGWGTSVTVSSIILAFGVSALIGVVFGYYPARRASKLNPIEALRFE